MIKFLELTTEERKCEFEKYLFQHVKSAQRYIADLERGYLMAPVFGYDTIYDITDPDVLEDVDKTRELRNCQVFTRKSVGGTAGLAGLNWYIRFLKDSRDSYYEFMNHFGIKPKDFFEWGMEAIIFPSNKVVEDEWTELKRRVLNDQEVFIRGYGRDAHGTQLYLDFYKFVFGNAHVKKDPTNNNRPQSNIKRMTALTRNKDIYNYQVSHIWGHTKNIFLFEAPWNICYTPKIIDPFTGHETKGDLPKDFQEYFLKHAQKKYRKYINDYNRIVSKYNFEMLLKEYCDTNRIDDERFVQDALAELSPIEFI